MTLLETIIRRKREEVAAARRRASPAASRDAELPPPRDFAAALRGPGLSVIAEFKRRSPSRGLIRADADPATVATVYERAGASAVSVLTDSTWFGGVAADLTTVKRTVGLPVLRKDFLIDVFQLQESQTIGADAVLLIARILDDAALREFIHAAAASGMTALVEVHDERELDRAIDAGARIIGVNNRDLDTLNVDTGTATRLRPQIPMDCVAVAESGIHSREDMTRMRDAGYDAVLIGETLMTADDPAAKIAELTGPDVQRAGRLSPRADRHANS
ncbi:MAG: indole-3-glycerol phosphate synthase TrpC [Phycisphaerales bacterium]|nr:indole-3-glycerol phosphate synthase TrpC [Phycisphaerales bacterium]